MTAGVITVDVNGRDLGLATLLTKLESEMQRADQVGITLGNTLGGGLASSAQRAVAPVAQLVGELRTAAAAAGADEETFLGLASALSQEALAAGNAARATEILDVSMGTSAGLAIEAAAADRALAEANAQVAASAQQGSAFMQGMAGSFTSMIGPAAAAAAAIGLLRGAIATGEEGFKLQASLDASHKSIELLLRGVRDSGEVFAGAARFANQYKLTQQETTEAITASIRVIRQSKAPIEDIFGAFARLKVLAPEKTFQDAARAIGELQAGQIQSIHRVFNISADEANRMKDEIEKGGDAVVLLNQYLDRTGVTMDAVRTQSEGAAGKLREMAQASESFSLALSGGAGGPGLAILETRIAATSGATRLLTGDTQAMGQSLVNAANEGSGAFSVLAGVFPGLGAAMQQLSGVTADLQAKQAALSGEGSATAVSLAAVAFAARDDAVAMSQASQAGAILASIQADTRRESILLSQATQDGAIASATAATQKELEALQTQVLAQQNLAAANAFLSLNPNINAAGIQAQVTAGAITPLIGRLAELTQQVNAAKAALAGFSSGRPETGGDAIARSLGAAAANQAYFAVQTDRAVAAQRQQVLQTGTHAEKMRELNAEYQRQVRIHGVNSAEAINAQTKIMAAEDKAAGHAKAAGAAKLSDQAKLNNSLLSNQLSADQKLESAEEDHQQKLLDIDADFARKSLAQQRENEVSKRQSRADFYDKLTQDTKDIGPGIAQSLSAAYENAYAEAQKIAQAGNQKLADDYLKMKQRQISAEEDYQKKLAEARKTKDKDEAARLEAIHKLQLEANAEEEKQLLAGGDANVNARNAALTEEQKRYEEQQGKIGTAAENAAQRKIAAARLAGKAVQDENDLLHDQEATLNRISGGGNATTASPRTQVPGSVTTPAGLPGAAAATVDLSALAGKLDAIVSAVNSARDSITGAQKDTTGAVRGLGDRLMH
jgi:hypothetical protein